MDNTGNTGGDWRGLERRWGKEGHTGRCVWGKWDTLGRNGDTGGCWGVLGGTGDTVGGTLKGPGINWGRLEGMGRNCGALGGTEDTVRHTGGDWGDWEHLGTLERAHWKELGCTGRD